MQETRQQVHCSNQQSRITEILPEGKPGNESGELAVCTETRHEQRHNQRKRTKNSSATAESDFIIAGKQAEFDIAHRQKSRGIAEQQAEHVKRNAAYGACT